MAGAPAFVMTLWSEILKTRVFALPAIVNVFALASTAEIMPWNGMTRTIFAPGDVEGVALAADEALAAGEGGAFFLANAGEGVIPKRTAATQQSAVTNVVCFILLMSAFCELVDFG